MTEPNDANPAAPSGAAVPLRTLLAIYGTAFFSLSIVPMCALVVPLWALDLGASPFWIGVAIGARSLLPMLLSIHGGVLMDRLGTRRVMLAFTVVTLAGFPLYPLLPWVWALIALQLVMGLSQGLAWVGSQTLYGKLTRGSQKHAGRMTSFTNAGAFAGPLIAGGVWDATGAIGAFALLTLWALILLVMTLLVPREIDPPVQKITLPDLMPRGSDYARAFALCAIPVVALVMVFTFIRIAASGVHSSFYVVYLEHIGISGTLIGVLVACANLVASPAALVRLPPRLIKPVWLMVWATVLNIVAIAITPLFDDFWSLFVAAVFYGAGIGLCFPTLISLLSKAVPPHVQGMSIGLRTTINRGASLIVPVVMGSVAEVWDLEASFFVVGAVLLLLVSATAVFVWRRPGAYS